MKLVVLAGALATLFSLIGTPLLINLLRNRGIAQAIRESTDDVTYPDDDLCAKFVSGAWIFTRKEGTPL